MFQLSKSMAQSLCVTLVIHTFRQVWIRTACTKPLQPNSNWPLLHLNVLLALSDQSVDSKRVPLSSTLGPIIGNMEQGCPTPTISGVCICASHLHIPPPGYAICTTLYSSHRPSLSSGDRCFCLRLPMRSLTRPCPTADTPHKPSYPQISAKFHLENIFRI
jgi:hypothetical protein